MAWVGIVASLLGVVVGGLLQYFTNKSSFDRQRQWERDRLLQQKLEEIAEIAEVVGRKLAGTYGGALVALESGEGYRPEPDFVPIARLDMLVRFYAPELHNHVQAILSIRDDVAKPLSKSLSARPRDAEEHQRLKTQLAKGMLQAEYVCEALARGAAESARRRLALHDDTSGQSNSAAASDGGPQQASTDARRA